MTTQWNPAHAPGDTGGADRDGDAPASAGGGSDSGAWRGYTVPVPEHADHARPGGEEEPAHDGISAYPDDASAVPGGPAAPAAGQEPADAPGGDGGPVGEGTGDRSPSQRRSGRHGRHTAAGRGAPDTPGGPRGADRPGPQGADEDPDGLAGWVGSLAEAADDSRIAGRGAATGSFPAVPAAGRRARVERAPRPAGAEGDGGADRDGAGEPAPERTPGTAAKAAPAAENPPVPEPDAADAGADEGPEPLPRRVPGPSAVSGSFRAVDPGEPSDDEEYRPTTHDSWQHTRNTSRAELIQRLDALSTLNELGQGDLPQELTARSGQLLDHAGARLRLSAEHTVVALAGGTGSGKSSLFNALCGLELSQTGITRPTTSKAHACVWGHEGADALLGWLGVPTRYRHSRTSVLDSGDSELTGLVLLDLPDHDSVRSMHTAEADRLIGSVDLLVWVLDPQKYADAAVHHRYLAKMAGHGAVTVAVLNQVDKVEPDELKELLTDLRRLLESESGVHPRVLTTSTLTGQGIRDLHEFLAETVRDRRALVDRLVADLDQVVAPYAEYTGEGEIPETVPSDVRSRTQEGLARAAAVTAVADAVEANDVRRGRRRVGWPVARRAARLRKDPLAAVQLDFLRKDGDQVLGGPVDAHEAELETVLSEAADTVSEDMPAPWRRRMRAAARSFAAELPAELGGAVSSAVGDPDESPSWWRLARSVQFALLAVAGIGTVWAVVALVSRLGGGITGIAMFDEAVFVAYASALVVAALAVGWLTGVGCGNLVEVAAVQRREDVERAAQAKVREIAAARVVEPMEAELARYRAFRAAYAAAAPTED
ncbi:50S ribosome-binding GTPase [Nocardiopsis flavescens]|uniref:50S ribosome-binding GTPase n=1 Tax=Nocardiopsis flavescens TaxID=758803 RepID=A0A1M6IT68_9ACTN|nr:GTPase [Nocardiopsis flavescens]SHJ37595.1 50S ribosome-binding GTPase [Nocardiopsis flavescens]